MGERPLRILLVEDDDVDAEAVLRAFRKARVPTTVRLASDGLEALEILRGNGTEPLGHPHLILLDLNTPRMSGLELLRTLRDDPKLKASIVFVLTTSDAERDKATAYGWNVAGYLVKARVCDDLDRLVQLVECYRHLVEFPPPGETG